MQLNGQNPYYLHHLQWMFIILSLDSMYCKHLLLVCFVKMLFLFEVPILSSFLFSVDRQREREHSKMGGSMVQIILSKNYVMNYQKIFILIMTNMKKMVNFQPNINIQAS